MATQQELDEYRQALRKHDWWSEFSDDSRIARAGEENLQRLIGLQRRLDPDAAVWKEVMLELKERREKQIASADRAVEKWLKENRS